MAKVRRLRAAYDIFMTCLTFTQHRQIIFWEQDVYNHRVETLEPFGIDWTWDQQTAMVERNVKRLVEQAEDSGCSSDWVVAIKAAKPESPQTFQEFDAKDAQACAVEGNEGDNRAFSEQLFFEYFYKPTMDKARQCSTEFQLNSLMVVDCLLA